jgi:hypothetical protein
VSTIRGEVHFNFKREEYQNDHKALLKDLLQYTRSLEDASLAYCDVQKPDRDDSFASWGREPVLQEQVRRASEKLRRVHVIAPFLPLLMAARLRYTAEGQKYLELVRLCEVFAFRVYRWLGYRSNKGQSSLFRLGRHLFGNGPPQKEVLLLDQVMITLRGLLLYYCPNHAFVDQFKIDERHNDWYRWFGLKYFLYEYEEHLAGREQVRLRWEDVEGLDLEKSIEHILPQTPTDPYWTSRFDEPARRQWTHDLGNLCLTWHNSSYGNKPFPEKKGGLDAPHYCYAKSNLFMERALTDYQDWDVKAILARRQAIADWALQRWQVAEVASVVPEVQEEEDVAEE